MVNWNKIHDGFCDGLPPGISEREEKLAWYSYQAELEKQDWFAKDLAPAGGSVKKFSDKEGLVCQENIEKFAINRRLMKQIAAECAKERSRASRNMPAVAAISALVLAVYGLAYSIYHLVPIKYTNVAEHGTVRYWRTLSGKEGLRIRSNIPDVGTKISFRNIGGAKFEYTIFPKGSPLAPDIPPYAELGENLQATLFSSGHEKQK
jgi:hypothetical protein